jgi:Tol biopolymer transport system component
MVPIYIFNSPKDGQVSLWAVRDSPSLSWLQPAPTQLSSTPMSLQHPLPSHDGRSIYAIGGEQTVNVFRYDPATRESKPVLAGVNVTDASFSPDHQWMLYSSGNQLWRSHPDGSERLELVESPTIPHVHAARWSPDSKRILFVDTDGGITGKIYLVSGDGGPAQQPLPLPQDPYNFWPDWSADGKAMVFARAGEGVDPSVQGLYLFDFEKHNSTMIPGSVGLNWGRWSPDGRFLAGVAFDTSVMKLLDLKTHQWSEVARGTLLSYPVWSADSVLYFQDILSPGEPVYRFQPGGSAPQRAYGFEDILESHGLRCAFLGFGPDGSLLVQVNRGGGDVYALAVNLP